MAPDATLWARAASRPPSNSHATAATAGQCRKRLVVMTASWEEGITRGGVETITPFELEQQRLDAVCVDHVLARRPGEDREVPILRRHERDGIALILDELRGRQMPCAAELARVADGRNDALDQLGDRH